jgi:hypothetical protein
MSFLKRLFGGPTPPDPPDSAEYRALVERSMEELRLQTAAHDGIWHLSEAAWELDLDAGTLTFTHGGMTALCPAQVIGTYDTQDGTWLWGWDHPSVPPPFQEHARAVKAYGEQHGIPKLTRQQLSCDEAAAWEFTALARHLSGAQGGYRGPAGTTMVFLTFGEVRLSRSDAPE